MIKKKYKQTEKSLGNIMIDIKGTKISSKEIEKLKDPKIAGVILFSRNYESPEQLLSLTQTIHQIRHPRLLIGVDHEGGRVQRFRTGFTIIPAMRLLGQYYDADPEKALSLTHKIGWVMATELLAYGIDFSFTPVIDLDYGGSKVIGDRAFHANPKVVGTLAYQLMQGMRQAGMASVAKHFPGHGFIEADTHYEMAQDERSLNQIIQQDIQPFLKLIENDLIAVMPAHVIYPQVDALPAGFSKVWLDFLRQQCHFNGAIISDDLSMQASKLFGEIEERAELALEAGCDLILVCNDELASERVLSRLTWQGSALSHARLIRLHGKPTISIKELPFNPIYQSYVHEIKQFVEEQKQQDML